MIYISISHWGRVTHIWVGNQGIIGSDDGLYSVLFSKFHALLKVKHYIGHISRIVGLIDVIFNWRRVSYVTLSFDHTHDLEFSRSNFEIASWLLLVIHAIHYNDVIMSAMASQITSLTIVYSTVYSGADQRKYQSSASLAFVRGIHRLPVNSPLKGPVTWRMFPFDDVIVILSYFCF